MVAAVKRAAPAAHHIVVVPSATKVVAPVVVAVKPVAKPTPAPKHIAKVVATAASVQASTTEMAKYLAY